MKNFDGFHICNCIQSAYKLTLKNQIMMKIIHKTFMGIDMNVINLSLSTFLSKKDKEDRDR